MSQDTGPRSIDSPLSILVVGCGAISELFHLPVLGGHSGFRIAGLADRNLGQARKLARQYGVHNVYSDVTQIPSDQSFDCALVATPPGSHAGIALELLNRRIPVLVEKPFALNYSQACLVTETAQKNETVLAAGYFRRLFPGCQALKQALLSGRYGHPEAFYAQEGSFFDWPSLTMGSMRKESAGGGVLIDTGSHLVDQVLSLFDFDQFDIRGYRHDAWGSDAIEATALAELSLTFQRRPVPGSVRLSRIADWPSQISIITDQGLLAFSGAKRDSAAFYPRAVLPDLSDFLAGTSDQQDRVNALVSRLACGVGSVLSQNEGTEPSPNALLVDNLRLAGVESPDVFSAFWAEWEDFRLAVLGRKPSELSGSSVLPTVRLIETCYELAQKSDPRASLIVPDWMTERQFQSNSIQNGSASNGLGSNNSAIIVADQNVSVQSAPVQPAGKSTTRVLITGATGFIGCRMAEILSRSGYQVRALVHSAAKAGRLMRLAGEIEIVEGDLLKRKSLKSVIQGCQAVIHCAYGTSLERKTALAATVTGTRNIAQAARETAINRFIYCSTLAVNGTACTEPFSPQSPLAPDNYDYARSKTKAEQIVQQEIKKGLKGVVFRLGNVYGPFSAPWTIRILRQIQSGFPVLYEAGIAPSNTIYVDNVVEATRCALICPEEAVGKVYVLADRNPTWREFYQSYADAMNQRLKTVSDEQLSQLKKQANKTWLNLVPRSVCSMLDILKGEPLKRLLIQFLTNDPLGTVPRWVFYECPGVRPVCRLLLGLNRPDLYYAPQSNQSVKPGPDDVNLFDIYACPAPADDTQTRSGLGYQPVVTQTEAVARTLNWAREAGLISCPAR